MNTTQLCEYNFCCEDYAKDGSWKAWAYNIADNGPAKHEITFSDKEQNADFTYKICDGCLAGLESDIEFDDNLDIFELKRIVPQTESYEGKRGSANTQVHQVWTMEEYKYAIRRLHKLFKRHLGHNCTEECYDREILN